MEENKVNGEEKQRAGREAGAAAAKGAPEVKEEYRNIDFLLDIPLQVSVEVGRTRILVRDLLQMQDGYIVELDKPAGKPLDLYVNSKLIAKGEPVLVNDKLGLRLTDVISPAERLEKLE
ncbi:MAG: flagellar motor switch protein FliN [Deltaproteobacteria bacterium]|nr:flagellar motor switch protein FliN [Deltaproteobacteria bacterium]